ncbi:ABC transporter substrate-binding protein [Acrocarpospora macrocephala]|uniref:Nitrate ABC transporter substrate-binding protein n=1 Tax=Acrocarpospora macrocephala TaxID=150177 RepID=A0A5M3WIL2_9ACTN|nr:ABC transporter substrate-binding protein [Acrocarpospora macrocephala]GES08804.1 nitrate ABC transporter substrate-binding protein [Acrocarpospora macrocephala]
MKITNGLKTIAVAATVAMIAAGCGSGGGGGTAEGAKVIRFAFAPDPVWDLMKQAGTIQKWEQENNVRIETSTTWDEFTYFAGGHGDIVSMATQETPVLEAETKIKTVTFGKYNYQRVPLYRRAGDPYKTLADIPKGSKICVSGPTSNTGFWTLAAKRMHNLDYRVGGGDFNLVVNDHFVNPTNLLRGDCEAAAIIPEAAVPQMRKGELEIMYDGKLPFQLYQEFAPSNDGQLHVSGNNFVATEKWFDANQDLAVKFLELWQSGVEMWKQQKAETVKKFPQHFSVETDEDIAYITEFVSGDKDWFVDNVFLKEDWIKVETEIWDLMKGLHPDNHNFLAADAPKPRFVALTPSN